MAQPVIAGKDLFPAQRQTVLRNASLQRDRAPAECPLTPALDLTPAQPTRYLLPGEWEPALHNHRKVLI